jgi:hypothetical protein
LRPSAIGRRPNFHFPLSAFQLFSISAFHPLSAISYQRSAIGGLAAFYLLTSGATRLSVLSHRRHHRLHFLAKSPVHQMPILNFKEIPSFNDATLLSLVFSKPDFSKARHKCLPPSISVRFRHAKRLRAKTIALLAWQQTMREAPCNPMGLLFEML